MDSKEFGLVMAQQLLAVEDLHYGWWLTEEKPSIAALPAAQERYSQQLLDIIAQATADLDRPARILDVGCGTGRLLQKLLQQGYQADAVIPAPWLEARVHQRLELLKPSYQPSIFATTFEQMPVSSQEYDLILFSESYQYIDLEQGFAQIKALLKPQGRVLICDFFRTEHHGDGQPGDKSFGGGHDLREFYQALQTHGWQPLLDQDITEHTSPNIALLDSVLRQRIVPAAGTLDQYLMSKKPWLYRLIKWLFRKKLQKLSFKYAQGHRTAEVFSRYKNYRLLLLKGIS